MSLFSQFGDSGNIGSLPSTQQRRALISGTIALPSSGITSFSYSISDTPAFFVFREDVGANLNRMNFFYTDLNTGKTISTRGPAKINPTVGQSIIINPINGGIIMNDPTYATNEIQQSLDYGATWSGTGFFGNLGVSSAGMGAGWFDGTTFVILNNGATTTLRTTNGTSWSSGAVIGDGPALVGNNRSSYSGYWFSYNSATDEYKYRTSLGGADVNVTGYYLVNMSMNGRYLVRQSISTANYEYSQDGGASWSAFSTTSYQAQTYGGIRAAAFNDGSFWLLGGSGFNMYYDFSTNKWTSFGSFEPENTGHTSFYRGGAGSRECVFKLAQFTNASFRGVLICDRPQKPV